MEFLADEAEVRERLQPVIIGGGYCAYTFIRLFQETYGLKPIEVSIADIKAIATSSFVDYRVVPGLYDESSFRAAVEAVGEEVAAAGKVGIILGCGDDYVRLIARNRELLEPWCFVPYCDISLMEELQRKDRFYGICEELGIGYPRTAVIPCAEGAEFALPDDFRFPVVAKPSHWPSYTQVDFEGKRKVFFIDSREELEAVWSRLAATDYGEMFVVQEYVSGGDSSMRIVSGFVGVDGELAFLEAGHVLLEEHAPFTVGNPAIIVPTDEPELIDGARRFFEATGFRGMANFDVKVDSVDGSYNFFEINTRAGGSCDFLRQAGIDFIRSTVEAYVLGRPQGYVARSRDYCYSSVPKSTALRYVRDPEARETVRSCFRRGIVRAPYDWSADNATQRREAKVELLRLAVRFARFH